jgi:hypothetical protein
VRFSTLLRRGERCDRRWSIVEDLHRGTWHLARRSPRRSTPKTRFSPHSALQPEMVILIFYYSGVDFLLGGSLCPANTD